MDTRVSKPVGEPVVYDRDLKEKVIEHHQRHLKRKETKVKGKSDKLAKAAEGFGKTVTELNQKVVEAKSQKKVDSTEAFSEPEEKSLFSRKVAWMEKIAVQLQRFKHKITIGFNNFRLSCHLYKGREERRELKRTIDVVQSELDYLNNRINAEANLDKARENFEDGNYRTAFGNGVTAAAAALKAGLHNVAADFKK